MKITIKTKDFKDTVKVSDVFRIGFGHGAVEADYTANETNIEVKLCDYKELSQLEKCLRLLRELEIEEEEAGAEGGEI